MIIGSLVPTKAGQQSSSTAANNATTQAAAASQAKQTSGKTASYPLNGSA